MNITILTCAEMPDMLPYDMEVIDLLRNKGVKVELIIWEELLKTDRISFESHDLVLIRTIWDYYKKVDKFNRLLDKLEDSNVTVLNPIDIVRWNMDKKYLLQLQNEGYDIIPTIFNFGEKDSFSKAIAKGWKKMILKPMISAGSYHTFVIESHEYSKFNNYIAKYYMDRPYMLQEFIPEIASGEISTITLSSPHSLNSNYSYSITKVPKNGDYRVQFDYGGVYHVSGVDPEIQKISELITRRFEGRLLYQRLDGLWRNGKFLIMEIELIEPDLYLNLEKEALTTWVENILNLLSKN